MLQRLSDTEGGPDEARTDMYKDVLVKLLVISFPREMTDEQFDSLLNREWNKIRGPVRGNRSLQTLMTWEDISILTIRTCERCIEILRDGCDPLAVSSGKES